MNHTVYVLRNGLRNSHMIMHNNTDVTPCDPIDLVSPHGDNRRLTSGIRTIKEPNGKENGKWGAAVNTPQYRQLKTIANASISPLSIALREALLSYRGAVGKQNTAG